MADDSDSAPVDVLLVEDDSADVLLIREVFEQYKIRNALYVVGDGEQAMEFVRRTGEFADVPRPGLILLDINLPRRNGLEVLAAMERESFDLVLMDVQMPEMGGLETTAAIREKENPPATMSLLWR